MDYNIYLREENKMTNESFSKVIVLGIVLFFAVACVIPSNGTFVEMTSSTLIGSAGYIQDLIDNASDGDTIFIPSGIYYENLFIKKSISLIGEDKDTTIINGRAINDVVYVSSDWVNISCFTIKNSGKHGYPNFDAGVDLRSNYNTITDSIISNNINGIYLEHSNSNNIKNNTIIDNENGICIYYEGSDNNSIKNNIILNNGYGIGADVPDVYSSNNIISRNNISNNRDCGISIIGEINIITNNTILNNNGLGLYLIGDSYTIKGNIIYKHPRTGLSFHGDNSTIKCNTLSNNNWSINIISDNCTVTFNILSNSKIGLIDQKGRNIIQSNNFLDNKKHALFNSYKLSLWNGNYWNRPRILPKLIIGDLHLGSIIIPWFNIDWHPAFLPNKI